jgi:hypothetical protein
MFVLIGMAWHALGGLSVLLTRYENGETTLSLVFYEA